MMTAPDGTCWMTVNETAAFYGVSRRTVYNWLRAGKVTTQRSPGGPPRILVDTGAWEAARLRDVDGLGLLVRP